MAFKMDRKQYADMFGPTKGDRVRLADTDLLIEVEKDFTSYGDEVKFGGGKVIRDGMGQSATLTRQGGALDLLITNVLILDCQGIIKADIGIRNGRICGVGKAGNPDLMDAVDPSMVIGASTEVIAGEGLIATPGGIDTHISFYLPAADRRGHSCRHHYNDRRRDWSGHRHKCDDLFSRRMEHTSNARSGGSLSHESRFSRQRQLIVADSAQGTDRSGRDGAKAA